MRLIDWDKVLEWMHRQKETTEQWSMRIAIENYVDDMPTVDAEPVVRCKDCIFYLQSNEECDLVKTRLRFYEKDKRWTDDCFCSWGERREDG